MKLPSAAALLLLAGLAVAQTGPSGGTAPTAAAPGQAPKRNIPPNKKVDASDRAALNALAAHERAEISAVKADATKSKADKKTSISGIHAKYRTKRAAVLDAKKT